MSEPTGSRNARVLRVAVEASDAIRRDGLAALVTAAGHELARCTEEADVLLTDGSTVARSGVPAVLMGAAGEGMEGWLTPDADATQLDAALHAVAVGLIVRAPAAEVNGFGSLDHAGAPLLTPRELTVLSAIADGMSNKAVARLLGISPHTVKFHIESLVRKLDVTTRAEAVKKGLRLHRIEL
jgi:DNA-binding NarL/FixJ family response regulator